MADFLHNLLFGIYPYIALAVLALGSIIRFDREPYSWRSGSSQLLRRKQLMVGSVLFHVGVLFIFVGQGRALAADDAKIDALLESEVRVPEATEAELRFPAILPAGRAVGGAGDGAVGGNAGGQTDAPDRL